MSPEVARFTAAREIPLHLMETHCTTGGADKFYGLAVAYVARPRMLAQTSISAARLFSEIEATEGPLLVAFNYHGRNSALSTRDAVRYRTGTPLGQAQSRAHDAFIFALRHYAAGSGSTARTVGQAMDAACKRYNAKRGRYAPDTRMSDEVGRAVRYLRDFIPQTIGAAHTALSISRILEEMESSAKTAAIVREAVDKIAPPQVDAGPRRRIFRL